MNWTILLGFSAAILTTISFLPQLIKTIRTKHTKDLSFGMYSLLTSGIFLWMIYGLLRKDIPVIIANAVALLLSLIVFIYKIIYK
ncbi:MAG: SemiSWEET transporter [Spirochaetes bacterium]|nr:SemiSWEET transporter [Spirochaetota bacterium]